MEMEFNHIPHDAETLLTCPHCDNLLRVSTLQLQHGLPVAECPHCLSRIELPSKDVNA